ncbi:hypothetical protein RhiirC2_740699 [Rhizophagus irregularis]|uniref:Uncharacterized protein n=1 Tax=Rhizophagus irregularis TaxID=588596 RepID=A0A2N1NHX9_9GLOM|nr:hypothetical protein RhiirC2_740699 [Rhizophagus irregularis]
MEFKLELLEQHISELEAENTELNDENTKLRQVIEENAIRRGTRTKEQKNTELEARIALLEQGVTEVNGMIYSRGNGISCRCIRFHSRSAR